VNVRPAAGPLQAKPVVAGERTRGGFKENAPVSTKEGGG
jgi:hypothetical protein